MGKVKLLFEDTEGGLIAFRADYQGGFEPTSPAHLTANQVIKFLDDMAAKKIDILPCDGVAHGHA